MSSSETIGALEEGLLAEARGEAVNLTKTHVAWGAATLHAIGAAFPKEGVAGTKTWAHTEGGATPLLMLYDARDGALRAVIEAFALGQLRTGAASGVATRLLAAADADELAIIGAGRQALTQVAAVAAVRPLRRVRVYSRDAGRCAAFTRRVQDELGIAAVCADSIAEAVRDANIVTTATRAKEPFLAAAVLAKGAHVNAIGAITPSGAEVQGDVLARCGVIAVDTLPQAQTLSRELIAHVAEGGGSWEGVHTLASLLAAGLPRPEGADLTLFKSLGMGISDLALGIELLKRAEAAGVGRRLPHPERAAPRLRPRKSAQQEELLSGKTRV